MAFTVTAAGTKTTPVVIWRSENPCYQGVDKSLLPVNYFSQKKAWMTGDILDLILSKTNCRLFCTNQSVSAGCHPENLKTKFSNIKVSFFTASTTSKLQPLDLFQSTLLAFVAEV